MKNIFTSGSFSKWFQDSNHKSSNEFITEDYSKAERLLILNDLIDLPFNQGLSMSIDDILNYSSTQNLLIQKHNLSEVPLGLRFIPLSNNVKLKRVRGLKLEDVKSWIRKENLNNKDYEVQILPHIESPIFSTIFVVNNKGVFGEIISDAPNILTQNIKTDEQRIQFNYNFNEIVLSSEDSGVIEHIKYILKCISVSPSSQELIQNNKAVSNNFSNKYLNGYFETVFSTDYGLWFIDYNRVIGKMLASFEYEIKNYTTSTTGGSFSGIPVSQGIAFGKIRIINTIEDFILFNEGDILVCKSTSPEMLPIMKKASGILTEYGGMLSHAAIVSRELGLPCISSIKNLLLNVNNDMKVEIDGSNGIVNIVCS